MLVKMLVLTPQSAFGELIRQSLEQTGQYQVLVSQTANIALSLAQQNAFDLAILDSDLGVKAILRVGQTLLNHLPQIKLIAIPPNSTQDKALMDELHPHGYLTKPFYLPNLVESLEKVLTDNRPFVDKDNHPMAPVTSVPAITVSVTTPTWPDPKASMPASTARSENDLTADDCPENGDPTQKDDLFIPNPIEQSIVAEAGFKESDGKTVPLFGLMRTAPPRQIGDTTPIVIRLPKSATHLEPHPSFLTRPVYTSALVPRMPQHYLTGEVADQLSQWVPQFCQAFGWNLEWLKIRPDYLEWMVRIPLTLSPGKMLIVIRERTSQRIFTYFKHINEENPSGNYWAPGFLIVSGAHSLPLPVLDKYVTETRQRQGA